MTVFDIQALSKYVKDGNILQMVSNNKMFYVTIPKGGWFSYEKPSYMIHFVENSSIADDLTRLNTRLRIKACTNFTSELNTAFKVFAKLLSAEMGHIKFSGYLSVNVREDFFKDNALIVTDELIDDPFVPNDIL